MFGGQKKYFAGKHAFITGGSEGIGFALAEELVRMGGKVTIFARTQSKLDEAKARLLSVQQKPADSSSSAAAASVIVAISGDVTEVQQVADAYARAVKALGPVDIMICNAGRADFGYVQDLPLSTFDALMKLNYFGTLHAIQACYSDMVARGSGQILLMSSALGLISFTGCAAYAPSKFAVTALAATLRNELQGTGVSISVAYPPDTLTPGMAREQIGQPQETRIISDGTTAFAADKVARSLLAGLRRKSFVMSNPDIVLDALAHKVAAFGPRSFLGMIWECILGLLAPPIFWAWTAYADWVARKHVVKRMASIRAN